MNSIVRDVEEMVQFVVRADTVFLWGESKEIYRQLWRGLSLFAVREDTGRRLSGYETHWAQDREQAPKVSEQLGDSVETGEQDSDRMRGGI